MKLDNKIAVVTGGSRGLGMSMCRLFAEEGAIVIAVDINAPENKINCIEYYELDITDGEKCLIFYDWIIDKYGRVDVLVNNAGITRDTLTKNMTGEEWSKVVDTNLSGAFNITRYIGPKMESDGYGSIINISSAVGEYGNIGQANYAAAKAGLIGLTKSWAKEFARKGANVRANCIAPGYIRTEMIESVPHHLLDKFKSMTMLGRLGEPEEIAKTALFLASDDSSYITGQVISVNGGLRL